MLKEKMKNVLTSYLVFLAIYLIICFILPYFFRNLIVIDKTAFIAINISFAITFLITYIKNKDK